MKTYLILVLLFAASVFADVTKKTFVPVTTNALPTLPPAQAGPGTALKGFLQAGVEMEFLMENLRNTRDMFSGATNMIDLVYVDDTNVVTVMIVNPYVHTNDLGAIRGRYYVLFPESWQKTMTAYDRTNKYTGLRTWTIGYGSMSNRLAWELDLSSPFKTMNATNRASAARKLAPVTKVPIDRLAIDPGKSEPVWIGE